MKRLFDIICSLIALILLSPVFAVIAIVIAADDGPPVIFRQNRVGKDEKLFKIYKFRTMKKGTRNASTHDLVESGEVVTRPGRVLRRLSLDELPQLVNILKGDMSFVGPRPLIPEETEIRELRRARNVYSVRPGVTGWSQINGRDLVDNQTKAKLDQEYVQRQSFLFDLKILFKTVIVVLKHDGVAEGGDQAQGGTSNQQ